MHAVLLPLMFAGLGLTLGQDAEIDVPPTAPPRFSQVVGEYDISASANPTEVRVEEPITLTVRITGTGYGKYQPERAKLRLFPDGFGDDFYLETMPAADKKTPDGRTWEFGYRLRPKRDDVAVIPGLQLLYYSPARRKFESSFSDEIPIKVTPKPATTEKADLKIIRAPERFYRLRPIEEVLGDDSPLPTPGPVLLVVLLALPPLACFAWYRLWRKLNPNAAERRARRQSRAARLALAYLRKQRPDPPRTRAAAINYLRQRFDLAATEATPREVGIYLKALGLSKAAVSGWEAFLRSCDEFCFGPRGTGLKFGEQAGSLPHVVPALTAEAIRLIQAVEGEPCVSG